MSEAAQSGSATLSPELCDRLLYYAWRAPSPHNAQGWRIEVDGGTFRVSRDPAHQVLRELDPEGREGDLACGAVVTNLCVGARAFGFDAEVSWRPAEGVAADVTLVPGTEAPDEAAADRLHALRRRAMNRSPYRADAVPGAVVEGLQATAKRLGFTLGVLTDRAGIDRMAALAARAGVMKMMHEPTQTELYSLMRFGPRAAAEQRDGLDLELFFTPAAAARAAAVATHPRVLRVLQEHEFERLGSTRTQQVDVRVIAATHRDLKQMVEEGTFRSDLYYRLHVFPLVVPPLRERREDIPLIIRHFVDKYAQRMRRRIEIIPARTMEVLANYRWPGNVRELQNFVERAVILSPGTSLRAPLEELKQDTTQASTTSLSTLEEMEREHVLRALRESNWVTGGPNGAAVRLGMKRTTLAYRIRKLGIPVRP